MIISETIAKEWYWQPNQSGWGYSTILRSIFPVLERIVTNGLYSSIASDPDCILVTQFLQRIANEESLDMGRLSA